LEGRREVVRRRRGRGGSLSNLFIFLKLDDKTSKEKVKFYHHLVKQQLCIT